MRMQGALEVWDYSQEHLRRYEPLLVGRDVRLRHVPFTWFPLVRASPDIVGVALYIMDCFDVLGALSDAPDDASTSHSPALAAG